VVLVIALAAVAVFVFWVARERVFFLGDGYLVLRNLGQIHNATTIPMMSFRDAPLTALVLREVSDLLAALGRIAPDELAYRVVSIGCGLGWIGVAFWLARLLAKKPLDRALVVLFLLGWGGMQLYFGYLEIYSPASCLLLLFLTTSIAHLRGAHSFLMPSAVFGALLATHFGMGVVVPAYLWLCYVNLRNRRFAKLFLGCLLTAAIFALSLAFAEYTPSKFLEFAASGGSHALPLMRPDPQLHAYALFSPVHFAEIGNLLILASPLAFLLAVCCILGYPKSALLKSNESVFLLVAMISCGGFLFLMNPELGMSRDWDLFSLYTIPVVVFAAAACAGQVDSENERRSILWIAASAAILHVIPWIALNANEAEAVERFALLDDPRVWGKTAVLNSFDELSSYYRRHDDRKRGLAYYEMYIAVDSSNGRILGNAGSMSQDLGDDSSAIRYYEMAIRHNTKVNTAYDDLAKLYAKQGRYDEAIQLSKRGLAVGFITADALNNLGAFIIKKTNSYREPLLYFQKAIEIDSLFNAAYLNAGISCSYLHLDAQMIFYLSKFLELRPDYPEAARIVHEIERAQRR
jgi:tetratricopeptide (TPR) repeat protein